ncbi:uncharacterized protein [Macrobrachium rosenbergii]|uniref:uncharacterized protein n=1 Tax=Macrobrachium rosenbergii TaxID=79674 RepID=UPI0034D46E4E
MSTAEKVFGESLVVLGELITEEQDDLTTQRLCDRVGKFATCWETYTNRTSPFMPPSLSPTTHVFVRNDAVRPPLTRPYRGPFPVLERNKKAFQVAVHGKEDWVSIDRLKPAFLEEDVGGTSRRPSQEVVPPQPAPPARKPRGRPQKAPGPGRSATQHSHPQGTEEVEHTPAGIEKARTPLPPQQIPALIRRHLRLGWGGVL